MSSKNTDQVLHYMYTAEIKSIEQQWIKSVINRGKIIKNKLLKCRISKLCVTLWCFSKNEITLRCELKLQNSNLFIYQSVTDYFHIVDTQKKIEF